MAVSAGNTNRLAVGKNGVFYDRSGRDSDVTVGKTVEKGPAELITGGNTRFPGRGYWWRSRRRGCRNCSSLLLLCFHFQYPLLDQQGLLFLYRGGVRDVHHPAFACHRDHEAAAA